MPRRTRVDNRDSHSKWRNEPDPQADRGIVVFAQVDVSLGLFENWGARTDHENRGGFKNIKILLEINYLSCVNK